MTVIYYHIQGHAQIIGPFENAQQAVEWKRKINAETKYLDLVGYPSMSVVDLDPPELFFEQMKKIA